MLREKSGEGTGTLGIGCWSAGVLKLVSTIERALEFRFFQ